MTTPLAIACIPIDSTRSERWHSIIDQATGNSIGYVRETQAGICGWLHGRPVRDWFNGFSPIDVASKVFALENP